MGLGGYDAIVLAGGAGRRMSGAAGAAGANGADKPMIIVAGRPMLAHVLAAVATAGRRIVVGPRRDPAQVGFEVTWCREDPTGGGPVAAIAAAMPHVRAATALVLAADLPRIAPAVEPLRAALHDSRADVAMLADDSGATNYLAAAWRTPVLRAAIAGLASSRDVPVRRLVEGVRAVRVPDGGRWGADCDTWNDIERLERERLERERLERERLGRARGEGIRP
jgi:molybdopterin-guanine dinucleotide biosynthesis protein A